MSYDYFLWRVKRVVEPLEIDESTIEVWSDLDQIRQTITELWPTMVWDEDRLSASDGSGRYSVRSVRLPDTEKHGDPLTIRTSHRRNSDQELLPIGPLLSCLIYDAQTGAILWQPPGDDSGELT